MANDFSGDLTCKALWRFDSGALTADSKGSNTLTAVNSPGESTGDYREGACAADLEHGSTQHFRIPDASLPADFPFKSGGSARQGTYCGWFKFESTGGDQGLIGKLRCSGSCGVFAYNGNFYLDWNNGWQNTYLGISTGVWYHVAVRMDLDKKTSDLRVYRASDGQVFTYSKSWGALTPPGNDFRVGSFNDASSTFDGLVDEVVIFNRLLSNAEIDSIRTGTFPPPAYIQIEAAGIMVVYGLEADIGNVRVGTAGLQVVYGLEADIGNVRVGTGGLQVVYSDVLITPPKRVFPVHPLKIRGETQPWKRKFPVVV